QQHRIELTRRYAAGAQGAQHRQTLLERQSDCGVDDEQAHDKRQQAESRQVQVKAVGEAFQIALRVRLNQLQPVTRDLLERNARTSCLAQQKARHLIGLFENPLGKADI